MKKRFLVAGRLGALAVIATALAAMMTARAQSPVTVTVDADKPGARINPAMWGIFFEDINLGADGGLYAELVKNRSFEFPDGMMGWSKMWDPLESTCRHASLSIL